MTSALPGIVFYGIARAIVCNSNSYIILCLIIIIYILWMQVPLMLCHLVLVVGTISRLPWSLPTLCQRVRWGYQDITIFDHVAMWLYLASPTSILYFFAILNLRSRWWFAKHPGPNYFETLLLYQTNPSNWHLSFQWVMGILSSVSDPGPRMVEIPCFGAWSQLRFGSNLTAAQAEKLLN